MPAELQPRGARLDDASVVLDHGEYERMRAVVAEARQRADQLASAGEGCPDCGAAGEPAAERLLEDAVAALWSTDAGGAR